MEVIDRYMRCMLSFLGLTKPSGQLGHVRKGKIIISLSLFPSLSSLSLLSLSLSLSLSCKIMRDYIVNLFISKESCL